MKLLSKVEDYLYEKLRQNRIVLDDEQIKLVIKIYSNKEGYKGYVDRFVNSLVEQREVFRCKT